MHNEGGRIRARDVLLMTWHDALRSMGCFLPGNEKISARLAREVTDVSVS